MTSEKIEEITLLYPAYVEIEGLKLRYVVEIQNDGEYSTHVELDRGESEATDEKRCIRIEDAEAVRKLAYALSVFADAMEDDEETGEDYDDYEEEEYVNEEEDEEDYDAPTIVKNEATLRQLEDMGIFLDLEDEGGED